MAERLRSGGAASGDSESNYRCLMGFRIGCDGCHFGKDVGLPTLGNIVLQNDSDVPISVTFGIYRPVDDETDDYAMQLVDQATVEFNTGSCDNSAPCTHEATIKQFARNLIDQAAVIDAQ